MKHRLIIFFVFLFLLTFNTFMVFADISVAGELTHIYTSDVDEEIDGKIIIRNNGKEADEVIIYQTDYLYNIEGENSFNEPGSHPRSNALWIDVFPERVVVPPKGEVFVNYKINIPSDSSLLGTYWSVIMVEPIKKSTQNFHTENKNLNIGLNIKTRYGIRIINNMQDIGDYDINILNREIVENENGKFFVIDVENSGEAMIVPEVYMEVYDMKGNFVNKLTSSKLTIFPGTSVRHSLEVNKLDEGDYKALVVVDNGDENIWGAYYDFEL
ncbi:MAG: hypothetical protein ACOCRK_05965 [bacterium]